MPDLPWQTELTPPPPPSPPSPSQPFANASFPSLPPSPLLQISAYDYKKNKITYNLNRILSPKPRFSSRKPTKKTPAKKIIMQQQQKKMQTKRKHPPLITSVQTAHWGELSACFPPLPTRSPSPTHANFLCVKYEKTTTPQAFPPHPLPSSLLLIGTATVTTASTNFIHPPHPSPPPPSYVQQMRPCGPPASCILSPSPLSLSRSLFLSPSLSLSYPIPPFLPSPMPFSPGLSLSCVLPLFILRYRSYPLLLFPPKSTKKTNKKTNTTTKKNTTKQKSKRTSAVRPIFFDNKILANPPHPIPSTHPPPHTTHPTTPLFFALFVVTIVDFFCRTGIAITTPRLPPGSSPPPMHTHPRMFLFLEQINILLLFFMPTVVHTLP